MCKSEIDRSYLVSVIVATYRRKDSLRNALISLANQSYQFIEIIVIDDNADLDWNRQVECIVTAVMNQYQKRIIYICNETNKGSAQSRNIGIEAASGEYVTFLDDDDVYLPSKIENQLLDMIHTNADYSITDLDLYSSEGKLVEKRNRNYIQSTDKDSLLKYHLMFHMTGTDTLMFKMNYIRSIQMFPNIDVGDEYYLMQRAILGNGVFCYSKKCLVRAYIHNGDNGLSSGQSKIDGENNLYTEKKKYYSYIDNNAIRYIRMRHFAVLAFAYLRMKKRGLFVYNSLLSFFSSPVACVRMLSNIKSSK